MQQYYVRQRGRITGPFELPELQKLRDQGRLTRVHELSTDQAMWQPAYEFEEVFQSYVQIDSEPALAPKPMNSATSAGSSDPGVDWFYVHEGDRVGPVNLQQLKGLIKDGDVQSDTLVWSTDLSDWSLASTVPQLKTTLRPSSRDLKDMDSGSAANAQSVPCSNCGAPLHPTATKCGTCGSKHSGGGKKRSTYILLAIFFGLFGVHNFYAKRKREAIVQLVLAVLVIGFVINPVWVLIECFVVNSDGNGQKME